MHVPLSAVPTASLQRASDGDASTVIRTRVEAARAVQRERFADTAGVACNAHAAGRWLLNRGNVTTHARSVLATAMESLKLSARGYHRVLRVARTIADLEQSTALEASHVAEALRFRPR